MTTSDVPAGQWVGTFKGQSQGLIVLNLESADGQLFGSAFVVDREKGAPCVTYELALDSNSGVLRGKLHAISAYLLAQQRMVSPREARELAPDIRMPDRIDFEGSLDAKGVLRLRWTSDAPSDGTAELVTRFSSHRASEIRTEKLSWEQFKREVSGLPRRRYIFRGQPKAWCMRTKFHRAGRSDLVRFARHDVNQLNAAIGAVIGSMFDTSNASSHAALLALAQHHGFPTPLLDWTWSPYVAAYFACRDATERDDLEPRVLMFDAESWTRKHPQVQDIGAAFPTVTVIEPMPIHNPRIVPQQSVVTFCNLDDIEAWIASKEGPQESYLRALDLTDDPRAVISDLRLMGISAGSLFPGLDGVCRGLHEGGLQVERSTSPSSAGKA